MIGAIILIVLLYAVTMPILGSLKSKLPWLPLKLMKQLYWFHTLFALVYYVFTIFSRSDSVSYYHNSLAYPHWFAAYTTGTRFIHFLAYPFTNYLFFTYEMMMVLFAWTGYWGFVYFYIVFKENLKFKHKLYGYDLLTLFVFLPNMHFWTASLGKGSFIFFGIAMTMYGLSNLAKRKTALILGLIIVYHIRPHIFLFMAVGILLGIFTGKQKIPFYQKFLVFAGSAAALVLMYDSIIAFVGLDQDNLLESFNKFSSNRASELAKAGSGIDTSNYPLPLKLVTFWFRPLFIDSPNFIGLIVSVENVLYVLLTWKLFDRKFWGYLKASPVLVKTSAVSFLATSFALSGTLSNLGIIIRQKSMVMYFLLFVIICFMDYKKNLQFERKKRLMERNAAAQELQPA